MATRARQRGKDHLIDFRLLLKPNCDRECAFGVPLEANGERAQAAQGEKAVVAGCRHAHVGPQSMEPRKSCFAAADETHQHV